MQAIGESKTKTEQFASKTLFIAEVIPGRRLAEFCLDLSNFPGSLAAASEILARHHVNILSGYHDSKHWSFFADVTASDCTVEQLQAELSSVPGAMKVLRADSKGVLVDALHFPLMWGKQRALLVRAQSMSHMLGSIKRMFGQSSPIAKVLLYQLGEAAGQAMAAATKAELGDEIRNELANVMNVYSATGWGIFQISRVNFEMRTATVVVLNNFECEFSQPNGPQLRSDFVRGHLAALFTEIFGKRVKAVEKACLGSGHGHCEFEIMPLKTS